jgi:hypothetical protein
MSLHVENLIEVPTPGGAKEKSRDLSDLEYIVLHRMGWNGRDQWLRRGYPDNIVGVRNFYRSEIGLSLPYTFVITSNGEVQQGWPVTHVSPHAKRFNVSGIGVALLGDFRTRVPPDRQLWAAEDLAAALLIVWPHLKIVAHDELGPGATSTPGKQCPGPMFNIRGFRERVRRLQYEHGARNLLQIGVTI